MGVGNEGTWGCLDRSSREYIMVVRVKQQFLVFFRTSLFKTDTESMSFLLKTNQRTKKSKQVHAKSFQS